jgi:hypothetical protein
MVQAPDHGRTRGEKWEIAGVLLSVAALIVAIIVALYGEELACRNHPNGSCKSSSDSTNPSTNPGPSTDPATPIAPTAPSGNNNNDPTPQEPIPQEPIPRKRGPQSAFLGSGQMTIDPPVCTTKGIDLDTLRIGDFPRDAELVYGDESCVRGSGQAFLSALTNAPLTHISPSPGPVPTLDQCIQGLSNNSSDDIQGMSARGGTLCFKTTAGRIAGVAVNSSPDQVVRLQVSLWEIH